MLRQGNVRYKVDRKGTGEYVCYRHWDRDYQRYSYNSWNNIRKSKQEIKIQILLMQKEKNLKSWLVDYMDGKI